MDFENLQASLEFSEKSIRLGFIRKVYGILTFQLAVTFGIVSIFAFIDPVKYYLQLTPVIFLVAFLISLVTIVILGWAGDVRRKTPYNIIFLIIFTICEGVLLGTISAYRDAEDVVTAMCATMLAVAGLTLFAFQVKFDFTLKSGLIVSILMVWSTFIIFAVILPDRQFYSLYSLFAATIFSAYFVVNTQLIIGGKHTLSISPEEYIFAALNLYLDVVNIFLIILKLSRK